MRMINALERFVQGQVQRDGEWRAADLSVRKVAALQALARFGRKVADGDIASIAIEPNLWPTSAVIDWFDLLKRAPEIASHDERLAQAEQILRSRLNFQGTTMGFSTERLDYLWWLMISGDVNANRLLLAMLDQPKWQEDVPRLVRGTLGRQQRGHWNTTVANAWGVLALEKFAAKFETAAVTGEARGSLAKQQRKLEWSKQPDGGTLMFGWPAGQADLTLEQAGEGKPWATIQSLAAIPLRTALSSGYTIKRTVTAVEQKAKGLWSRGDVARVRLDVEAQSDMSWVVVNDPVPAGVQHPRHGARARFADPVERGNQTRLGLAGVRGTQIRLVPRVLSFRAEGEVDGRIQRAPQQCRRLFVADDPRGSTLRTGDVR